SVLPERQELLPVRLVLLFHEPAQQRALALVLLAGERAAHQLEAQIEEISVGAVGLAVVADRADFAAPVRLPDTGAADAQLAGKARQPRQLIEWRAAAAIEREHIHQIEVPVVEAVDVVRPFGVLVVLAGVPEARGRYAVDQPARDQ